MVPCTAEHQPPTHVTIQNGAKGRHSIALEIVGEIGGIPVYKQVVDFAILLVPEKCYIVKPWEGSAHLTTDSQFIPGLYEDQYREGRWQWVRIGDQ